MRDSAEAATLVTVTGWLSRDGRFYGAYEDVARYAGCTHVACSRCGKPTKKPWTACDDCRDLAAKERYEAMPRAEWDGEAMLYSSVSDRYFDCIEDAEDSLDEGQTLADLRLVICKPNHVPQLTEDYFSDKLPEDGDLPGYLAKAIPAFNAAIKDAPVLSWSPGKFALELSTPADSGGAPQ